MKYKNKQKGMSGMSIMMLLALLAFVAVALLKVMPVYFDSFKVGDVISSLQTKRGLGDASNSEIKKIILKSLDVNMVNDVTSEHIFIERVKNDIIIDVEYEVRKQMFGNLDVIISFKKSAKASRI